MHLYRISSITQACVYNINKTKWSTSVVFGPKAFINWLHLIFSLLLAWTLASLIKKFLVYIFLCGYVFCLFVLFLFLFVWLVFSPFSPFTNLFSFLLFFQYCNVHCRLIGCFCFVYYLYCFCFVLYFLFVCLFVFFLFCFVFFFCFLLCLRFCFVLCFVYFVFRFSAILHQTWFVWNISNSQCVFIYLVVFFI